MKASSRIRIGHALVAGFAFLAIAVGNAASARAELIASYATGQNGDYYLSTTAGTTTLETVNPGFSTTQGAAGTAALSFITFPANINSLGVIAASINLVATSTTAAATGLGLVVQGGFSGSYQIVSLAASAAGPVGTTLLSATFSGATVSGVAGSTIVTFSDSTSTGGSVTLSSNFTGTITPPEDFSFTLGSLNTPGGLGITGSAISDFHANDVQTQNGTVVPEPSSMAIAGLGALGMIGYGLRRRKALGA